MVTTNSFAVENFNNWVKGVRMTGFPLGFCRELCVKPVNVFFYFKFDHLCQSRQILLNTSIKDKQNKNRACFFFQFWTVRHVTIRAHVAFVIFCVYFRGPIFIDSSDHILVCIYYTMYINITSWYNYLDKRILITIQNVYILHEFIYNSTIVRVSCNWKTAFRFHDIICTNFRSRCTDMECTRIVIVTVIEWIRCNSFKSQ